MDAKNQKIHTSNLIPMILGIRSINSNPDQFGNPMEESISMHEFVGERERERRATRKESEGYWVLGQTLPNCSACLQAICLFVLFLLGPSRSRQYVHKPKTLSKSVPKLLQSAAPAVVAAD